MEERVKLVNDTCLVTNTSLPHKVSLSLDPEKPWNFSLHDVTPVLEKFLEIPGSGHL